MIFIQTEFYSRTLEMSTQLNVLLPQKHLGIGCEAPVSWKTGHPVLYLLHGGGDDHTHWMRFTSLERYVEQRNLAVIMPNVNLSRYTNMAYGLPYKDYVEKELPEAVHSFFHLSEKREETFIAGASMGATGALTIGLSKPENYAAIGVFSAGNWVAEKMYTEDIMPAETIAKRRHTNFLVYGMEDTSPLIGNPEYDAFAMAQKALDEGKPLPKIFHATGTEDHKYENTQITRRFFESLPGNPFRYEYHECPGTHCWKVFDHWIQKFLDQIEIKE
ncbi:MAG: hypothetical protein K2P13_00105 [Lachnospiraceae bacterium]|nr:hypothetical protein [Lachnospiraceae bacterium]